jgi:hypothetical protein
LESGTQSPDSVLLLYKTSVVIVTRIVSAIHWEYFTFKFVSVSRSTTDNEETRISRVYTIAYLMDESEAVSLHEVRVESDDDDMKDVGC